MSGSSALGPGGMRRTAITCWRCAAPNITAHSIRCLCAINSGYRKRQNDRMLPVAECFPVLTLEQVYGAITYYLAHRADIDRYLQQADAEFDALRHAAHTADPQFHDKLIQARRQSQITQV